MSKAYVVWVTYRNGTGSTETFRNWLVAWLFAREKRHQGFRATVEKRFYDTLD